MTAPRRVGRPRFGTHARQRITLRIDPDVLTVLKVLAGKRRIGYQTLINDLLTELVIAKHDIRALEVTRDILMRAANHAGQRARAAEKASR